MEKWGCPTSPMWEREGEAWSEDESVSSSGSPEGNVRNNALHVIGLHGPGGKISLFLKDWELAKVALNGHMALDMLCQEMPRGLVVGWCYREACCHGMSAFLSPWTGCDSLGEGCGERKQ